MEIMRISVAVGKVEDKLTYSLNEMQHGSFTFYDQNRDWCIIANVQNIPSVTCTIASRTHAQFATEWINRIESCFVVPSHELKGTLFCLLFRFCLSSNIIFPSFKHFKTVLSDAYNQQYFFTYILLFNIVDAERFIGKDDDAGVNTNVAARRRAIQGIMRDETILCVIKRSTCLSKTSWMEDARKSHLPRLRSYRSKGILRLSVITGLRPEFQYCGPLLYLSRRGNSARSPRDESINQSLHGSRSGLKHCGTR